MPVDLARDIILRWDQPDPAHIPLLKQAGITAVLTPMGGTAFSEACAGAGMTTIVHEDLQFVKADDLKGFGTRKNVVLTNGIWPGIRRPPTVDGRGDETASASREPWVDSNGYWIRYLRTLYPERPAVLGYVPELGDRAVPFDSLELALAESQAAGGNYILTLEPGYLAALLRNEPKATAAWKQLGQTARWLREQAALFQQPVLPIVTALMEEGQTTAELANLMYRRNASPVLYPAAAPPAPGPASRLALVAANLRPLGPETARRIFAHARAGTTVVTATLASDPWWRGLVQAPVRSELDRDFYAVGKGQLVAYKKPVSDPSEFALDVIDIVTHRKRAVRLWNAPSIIAVATDSRQRGERLVQLVNYGSPVDTELQVRVQGQFANATLLRPEVVSTPLTTAKRGTTTEVLVPELRRVGVLIFS